MKLVMYWYVIHAKVDRGSKIVKFFNSQEGADAFIPKIEKWHNVKSVKDYVIKDLYPDYVFVKSDMDNEAFNKKFKEFFESIEGFGELLEYEGVYALKDAEQDLMEKLFNGGHIIKRSIGNIVDKKLIVDTGPLLGLDDLVIKINRHHRVATLQTEFFDKKIMVPLEVISKS